ncbi:MAG: hypothetical protein Q7S59_10330 [Sulfurimonas sp.]|nr:hypothetical protein [Sulfurimonas sp.]
MKPLESFLRKHTPARRVSALEPFVNQIIQLYDTNYSIEQIQEYLSTNKIEISTRRIYQFIKVKKNLSNKNFSLKTPSAASTEKKSENQGVANENSKATNAYLAKIQRLAQSENEKE